MEYTLALWKLFKDLRKKLNHSPLAITLVSGSPENIIVNKDRFKHDYEVLDSIDNLFILVRCLNYEDRYKIFKFDGILYEQSDEILIW